MIDMISSSSSSSSSTIIMCIMRYSVHCAHVRDDTMISLGIWLQLQAPTNSDKNKTLHVKQK